MPIISSRDEMPDISGLTEAMLKAATGKPMAEVAQAALDIAFGIWSLSGEVTREMAIHVVTSQIDARFKSRSN